MGDFVFVKVILHPRLSIPRAGPLVARNAADGSSRGAAGVAAHAAYACTGAAGAHTHADALGAVLGLVLDVAGGEGATSLEAVLSFAHGFVCAGDGSSHQGGVALHVDLEAAVSCPDAALGAYALVVAVHPGLGQAGTGAGGRAQGQAAAHAGAVAVVVGAQPVAVAGEAGVGLYQVVPPGSARIWYRLELGMRMLGVTLCTEATVWAVLALTGDTAAMAALLTGVLSCLLKLHQGGLHHPNIKLVVPGYKNDGLCFAEVSRATRPKRNLARPITNITGQNHNVKVDIRHPKLPKLDVKIRRDPQFHVEALNAPGGQARKPPLLTPCTRKGESPVMRPASR